MNKFEKLPLPEAQTSSAEQEHALERPFFEEERTLLEEAGKEIDTAPAEKLKKPGFRALAAFLTFLAGSTAFADRALAERDAERTVADEHTTEKTVGSIDLEFRNTYQMEEPPFDSGKIIQKLSLEKDSRVQSEEVGIEKLDRAWRTGDAGKFYENLLPARIQEVRNKYARALRRASSYAEFKENIRDQNLSDQEKLAFLQILGRNLSRVYNYDMLERGEHIKISEEDMFQALRGFGKGGICGNISDFLAATAQGVGIQEVWLQSGLVGKEDPSGHIWVGMIVRGPDGKEQIAFLDYGDLNLTGTLNLEDALALQEQRNQNISTFLSYISAKDNVLMPVQSKAEKLMRRTAGMEGSDAMLERNLARGEAILEKGLRVTLSSELSELKLSNDTLGIAYVHSSNMRDPYQSIQTMDALRLSVRRENKNISLENEVAILNMDIKGALSQAGGDQRSGAFEQTEIINRLAMNFLNTHELNLDEYRRFVISYGAAVEGAVRYIIDNQITETGAAGHVEESVGMRVAYLNPSVLQEVYFQVLGKFRTQVNDFEDQKILTKAVLEEITAGGVVNTRKGTFNIEGKFAEVEYGKRVQGRVGLNAGDISAGVAHTREFSDYSSLIPNAKTTSLEVGKRLPQGELVFFTSKTSEKYITTENIKREVSLLLRIPL